MNLQNLLCVVDTDLDIIFHPDFGLNSLNSETTNLATANPLRKELNTVDVVLLVHLP